jgi:oligoribonuclease NrnB/cAMP/cGMP phosphodiesterase (DHH superfamily)
MDADGHASAAVYHHYLTRELKIPESDIQVHPINYGMPLPSEINPQTVEEVVILDFSFSEDVMEALSYAYRDKLVWIDHHDTVVKMLETKPELSKIPGIRRTHNPGNVELVAACELTWEYCFGPLALQCPPCIHDVGSWDTWRWAKQPEEEREVIQNFVQGLDVLDTSMFTEEGRDWWARVLSAHRVATAAVVNELLRPVFSAGAVARKYQAKKWHSEVKNRAYEAKFLQYNVLMINSVGPSTMFDGFFDPNKHDFMVVYHNVGGSYIKVSLYAGNTESSIHLGELAKVLGHLGEFSDGGGHKGAAGFQTSQVLFDTMHRVIGPAVPLNA